MLLNDEILLPQIDKDRPRTSEYSEEEVAEIIERGHQASRLMNDPAFNNVITEMQDETISAWINSIDAIDKERCHVRINMLRDLQFDLVHRIDLAATLEAYQEFGDIDSDIADYREQNGGIQ